MTPLETMAAAIANARGGRRGAPPVANVLDILKGIKGGKLYDEVMEDARAMVEALVAAPLTPAMVEAWTHAHQMPQGTNQQCATVDFRAMLMACLK